MQQDKIIESVNIERKQVQRLGPGAHQHEVALKISRHEQERLIRNKMISREEDFQKGSMVLNASEDSISKK